MFQLLASWNTCPAGSLWPCGVPRPARSQSSMSASSSREPGSSSRLSSPSATLTSCQTFLKVTALFRGFWQFLGRALSIPPTPLPEPSLSPSHPRLPAVLEESGHLAQPEVSTAVPCAFCKRPLATSVTVWWIFLFSSSPSKSKESAEKGRCFPLPTGLFTEELSGAVWARGGGKTGAGDTFQNTFYRIHASGPIRQNKGSILPPLLPKQHQTLTHHGVEDQGTGVSARNASSLRWFVICPCMAVTDA